MKLYTEEISIKFTKWITKFDYHPYLDVWVSKEKFSIRLKEKELFEQFLKEKELSPIELPSDEEIERYVESTPYYGHCTTEFKEGIEDGAKWVIEQILNQNKCST